MRDAEKFTQEGIEQAQYQQDWIEESRRVCEIRKDIHITRRLAMDRYVLHRSKEQARAVQGDQSDVQVVL